MSIKQVQQSMTAFPPEARQWVLAFSILMDRLGELPKTHRDDLFELLQAWRTERDPEEQQNIYSAMMEIIAGEPLKATSLDLNTTPPTNEFARWFGKRVKEFREKKKWSQERLAEKAALPQSYVSRMENGEHSPTRKTVEKFAKALGVSVRDLDPCED